jgi:hypothetical protein
MQETVSMVKPQKCMKPITLARQTTTMARTVRDVTRWPMKRVVVMNTHKVEKPKSLKSSFEMT